MSGCDRFSVYTGSIDLVEGTVKCLVVTGFGLLRVQ